MRKARLGLSWVGVVAALCTMWTCSELQLPPAHYQNGLVVSAQELASRVGADIIKQGGNAVDAAVATSYALAVVHPSAGNLGGGGFMLIRSPDGFATAIDYREKAPGKSHRDMYLDEEGEFIKHLARTGALAAGVPGTVAGTLYALDRYGSLSRAVVLQPAIDLAEKGWILDRPMGGEKFRQFPSTNRAFNKPGGAAYVPGERWAQPDLARTLRAIAENGRDGFYRGETADHIVNTMQQYGGLISHRDLESYHVIERSPLTGTYRGYGLVSMPPVSSGGTTLIEILNILERYDIESSGFNEPQTLHLLTEAMRRGFADRNRYIADPDFVDVPSHVLISKDYADKRAKDIDTGRATPSEEITHGDASMISAESKETTHFSVVDRNGMAVAVTTTINGAYGSYLVVDGAGFLLNNQMGDFSAKTGVPNHSGHVYGDANSIEPHKRMISSQTPTIVTKDGKNFLVLGASGSGRIITAVLQTILNVVDHGMDIEAAVAAPRIHHQWLPDRIEYEARDGGIADETLRHLKILGHTLMLKKHGNVHAIMIHPVTGLFTGCAEPRRTPPGAAAGY